MRLARPSDREAVLSFAANTWGGRDYIPDVWDPWIGASDGILLVATPVPPAGGPGPTDSDGRPLDPDRPVAVTRVAVLAEGEIWFEGLRVDPRVRGRSVATHLQVAELRWAVAHRARVVRYATAPDNEASHRLGARHGFALAGAWRRYGGDEEEQGERVDPERLLERLREAGLGLPDEPASRRLWSLVEGDATFHSGRGLYEYRPWSVQALTQARFEAHVRRGEVVVAHSATGAPALAVLPLSGGRPDLALHVGLLAGTGEGAVALMESI